MNDPAANRLIEIMYKLAEDNEEIAAFCMRYKISGNFGQFLDEVALYLDASRKA